MGTTILKRKAMGFGCFQRRSFYSYREEGISIREIDTVALIDDEKIRRTEKNTQGGKR